MKSACQKALDYIYSFTDYGKLSGYSYDADRFDLKRVEDLLELVGAHSGRGAPHHNLRAIHVAGTKGKGSTSAMIASILRQAGYRTGLYTSPHLHSFRERMQIDGELISPQQIVAGVDLLRTVAPQVPQITTFELITALAFDYFDREGCDLVVLEVGMGGRLDATNVILPLVSVITPISYDHQMYLGNTLAAIAAEKAGIIKPGVPVVSAPQPAEALQVIERIAHERGSRLTLVGRDWHWRNIHSTLEGQQFEAWPDANHTQVGTRSLPVRATYHLPLLGRHQQVNATTALATIAQLCEAAPKADDPAASKTDLDIPNAAIYAGLESTQWPGRLEVLGRHPWVIVDGAHNANSMQKLRTFIDEMFPHRQVILIFGASADKDIDGMLDTILPVTQHVLVTQADHPRAATPESLAERIAHRHGSARGVQVHAPRADLRSSDQVLDEALRLAGQDDLVCVTGSLFVVAALRAAWFERTQQLYSPDERPADIGPPNPGPPNTDLYDTDDDLTA
jgi:dihydrofolate synthase/folylpolyglutamate synthase